MDFFQILYFLRSTPMEPTSKAYDLLLAKKEETKKPKEPKLVDYLYEKDTMEQIVTEYSDALELYAKESQEDEALKFKVKMHSKALINFYKNYVTNCSFVGDLRDEFFNNLYKVLDKKYPAISFTLEGRRKALIKAEEKMLRYLSLGKNLDSITDFLAFRIIIFGATPDETIESCYNFAKEVFDYCLANNYTACDGDPINEMDKTIVLNSEITRKIKLPKKQLIPESYTSFMKDYIKYPKKNGYQSIHMSFKSPDGLQFEIQIRGIYMHAWAEQGEADHNNYKTTTYCDDLKVDFDEKKMSLKDGHYISCPESPGKFDSIGLVRSFRIVSRKKTR